MLVEEKHQVLQFLHWQQAWWLNNQTVIETDNASLKKGLTAYALQQAALSHILETHFKWMWQDMQKYIELGSYHDYR